MPNFQILPNMLFRLPLLLFSIEMGIPGIIIFYVGGSTIRDYI